MTASPRPSLLTRLKQARIVQVLVVYLGASWVVLQIADTLTDALALPGWVSPVAVLLLLVGLVIIMATAWVQSLASTTAAEEAGEIPTDWEIAPADALDSLRQGQLPHLTWGRAILGGVVAMSLLFGVAGAFVLFTGGPALFGPAEAGASTAAEGIAVVPFEVRGDDLEIWREGMVDLLANNLDGVGGYRTIDPRTVMARWSEEVGGSTAVDLDQALRVAGATGARYAIVGSVVGLGDQVRIVSNVYDLDSRREVAQGQAEGPAADVLSLVDRLAVGTMRSLLQAAGREGAGDITAESLTTESLPALRAFLEGERHYRRGDFAEAVQSFERAVAEDSTFAIGLVRLSEAYGWLESQGSAAMQEYGERAVAHAGRLPPRYQFIMTAWDGLNRGTADGMPVLLEAVQKYPDDPEAWFLLAETYLHVRGASMGTPEMVKEAVDRAVALDPGFAPYLIHAADVAVMLGDRVSAEAHLQRYEELTGTLEGAEHVELAIPLILGDSVEVAEAMVTARATPARTLDLFLGTYEATTDRFDRMEPLNRLLREKMGQSGSAVVIYGQGSQGKAVAAERLIREDPASDGTVAIYLGHVSSVWNVSARDAEVRDRLGPESCNSPNCFAFLLEARAREGRWSEVDAIVRRVEEIAAEMDDAEESEEVERLLDLLQGLRAYHRGAPAEARRHLTAIDTWAHSSGNLGRLRLADLSFEQGRMNEAERYYRAALMTYGRPKGLYGLAKVAEARGDTAEATKRWRSFVTLTAGGDADYIPMIREGREALARLDGA